MTPLRAVLAAFTAAALVQAAAACWVPPHVTSVAQTRAACGSAGAAHELLPPPPPPPPLAAAMRAVLEARERGGSVRAGCAALTAVATAAGGVPVRLAGVSSSEHWAAMQACLEAGMADRGAVAGAMAVAGAIVAGGEPAHAAQGHVARGLLLQEVLGDAAAAEGEYRAAALLPANVACVAWINVAWAQVCRGAVGAALATLAGVEAQYGAGCPYRAHAWWNTARALAERGSAAAVIAGRDMMAGAGVLAAADAAAANRGACGAACASWYTIDAATLLPQVMPATGADIDALRADSVARLAALADSLPDGCLRLQPSLVASHVVDPPFGWHYAGSDGDRALLEAYAALLRCNYNVTSPVVAATLASRAARLAACSGSSDVTCWLQTPAGSNAVAALVAAGRVVPTAFPIPTVTEPRHRTALVYVPAARLPTTGSDALRGGAGALRVCFLSKYFTLNHPHAQLLAGVVRGLNRTLFEPVAAWLHNDDRGYFPDPVMAEAAGGLLRIPPTVAAAADAIGALACDVLVYVDHLSEGVSTALTFMRLAPVQALFWGNPVTSGKGDTIDYFISGELLEPPGSDAEYSETLVRLPASGIHYDAIVLPRRGSEAYCVCPAAFRLPNPPGCAAPAPAGGDGSQEFDALRPLPSLRPPTRDAPVVFGCPQSLYKLRPEYDAILARILRAVPSALLVMVTERREVHTRQYQARIAATMGAADGSGAGDVVARIRWVPRLSGATAYFDLLSCVDVMLQPLPFDGSRTAADTIAAAIPLVTLPTRHLRGRMAAALYTQLGLAHRLATDADDYVARAAALATNVTERAAAIAELRARRHLAFDRADIVAGWERFLLSAAMVTASAASTNVAAAND